MTCANCGYSAPEGARSCPACGQPLTGTGVPAAQSSWFKRNVKWVVPVGCLTILLAFALFFALIFAVVAGSFRSSDPYKHSLALAQGSAEVQRALGQPIVPGWFVSGSINVSGSTGEANLEIPISGPKGAGKIYVQAKKRVGKWEYQELQVVVVTDGSKIDLLREAKGPTSF